MIYGILLLVQDSVKKKQVDEMTFQLEFNDKNNKSSNYKV